MHAKGGERNIKEVLRASLVTLLVATFLVNASFLPPYEPMLPSVRAQTCPPNGSVTPAANALLIGSTGNVRINVLCPGIAVRIEIPREFLQGVVSGEGDIHFITSNIESDYYYYSLIDESNHWIPDLAGTIPPASPRPSDDLCAFAALTPIAAPAYSFYDPNAPYCVEIWDYINVPSLLKPTTGVNYCTPPTNKYFFQCFTAPTFVLLHNLVSPPLAGVYDFKLYIAQQTNALGYPDFVPVADGGTALEADLYVPVSMAYDAGSIAGTICGLYTPIGGCGPIASPDGIVYANNTATGSIVARAYVMDGSFDLTGLAPGKYYIEGSAGIDPANYDVAYSLTPLGYPGPPTAVTVSANAGKTGIVLPLRPAPQVCGEINFEDHNGNPVPSPFDASYLASPLMLTLGGLVTPGIPVRTGFTALMAWVEATDPFGHVFRYIINPIGAGPYLFDIVTGTDVGYVETDPYGTEYAGLPAPEDIGPSGYTLNMRVWVSGFLQVSAESVTFSSPVLSAPSCGPPFSPIQSNQPTVSPNPVALRLGGLIEGTLHFQTSPGAGETWLGAATIVAGACGVPPAVPPSPQFGGNIVIQAYDQSGILRGVTVMPEPAGAPISTLPDLPFFVVGFSEDCGLAALPLPCLDYNHNLSGVWHEHDYGLPDGVYSLQVYVNGYELTSTSPATVSIVGGSVGPIDVYMTRGGAFCVTVSSFDNRFGTRAPQAALQWRFLGSTIPVWARVYFYTSYGLMVGYVDVLMTLVPQPDPRVSVFTTTTFRVVFAGQDWSMRRIYFGGYLPTHITDGSYTIKAYTLGYVRQYPNGVTLTNTLVGVNQAYVTLFIGNELDMTVPLFSNPLSFTSTPESDFPLGQAFSSGLSGAENENLPGGVFTLQFYLFGFGEMDLSSPTLGCVTDVLLRGTLPICGQGHFFYVAPDGTQYFDYGLDVGNYTAEMPEFGFTTHFMQTTPSPIVQFSDLLLQSGLVFQGMLMATVTQGLASFVFGYCGNGLSAPAPVPEGTCLGPPPAPPPAYAPLSWAEVQASNGTYSRSTSTLDGTYDGVEALFLPAGTYTITFSDAQYQPQTTTITVGWGNSYPVTSSTPLCPTGTTCS